MALDLDQVQRIVWIASAAGFVMAALGILGELLGWWNDAGEVLVTIGGLAGVLLGVLGLLLPATRGQGVTIAAGVAMANARLDDLMSAATLTNERLERLDRLDKLDKLDLVTQHLNRQTGILVQIRDRL